jgi:hypothetical protein
LGGQTSVGSTNTRQNVTSALKALNNSDFQNRNGNYPRSGIPDTIYASDTHISFSFKNTNQSAAERWVRNYLSQKGFTVAPENVKSYQSGDYDDDWVEVSVNIKNISFTSNESCSRKPIPEGMTIEQLVEEMEENEDTVECTWCNDLFDKSECRKEVNLGWLCSRCEAAIKSRGETLTFKENNYWDFLDEDIDATKSLADLVKDSINHLVNDIGRDSSTEDFADDVITDIENNYDIEVPEDPEKYRDWASAVACEVSRQLNNPLDEDLDSEELHDLGNEYDGGYPTEGSKLAELEDTDEYSKRLTTCPECGEKSYDAETSFCISCGFN